jgi:superfamily II DNA helicase RecQ
MFAAVLGGAFVTQLRLAVLQPQAYLSAAQKKLSTWRWKSGIRPPFETSGPQVLIVGVEALAQDSTDKSLIGYLRTLHQQGRLSRFVYDEAHLFLSHHFRPVIVDAARIRAQIGESHHRQPQMVLLSVTLPPDCLPPLSKLFDMTVSPKILRASTVQPNISYQVKFLDGPSRWTPLDGYQSYR